MPLKLKKRMLYMPLDFGEFIMDALVDTGAPVSVIPEADMTKIRTYAPKCVTVDAPPPDFKIVVANGQKENPSGSAELQFEVGDFTFREKFVILQNITSPIIGLHFLRHTNAKIDVRQGLIHFPYLSMQMKIQPEPKPYKEQAVTIPKEVTIPPETTRSLSAIIPKIGEWEMTGVITPREQFTGDNKLLVTNSLSSTQANRITIKVTNTTTAPYTLKKNTTVADFAIMTETG